MTQNADQMNYALSQVTPAKRMKMELWEAIVQEYDVAENKGLAAVELQKKYGLKFSRTTLCEKYNAWKIKGKEGLMPRVEQRHLLNGGGTFPREFTDFWMVFCAQNQRKTKPAWRAMMEHLIGGKEIPGYGGNWRAVWKHDHPAWPVPDGCPYSLKANRHPDGWSYKNLSRHSMNAYGRAATRQGTASAKNYLPTIPTTRVGLPFARVFMIDDVEHDVLVSFLGNMKPQGVVELGALELLTGHYCAYGMKPIRERPDGSREKLKESYTRYLIAHILCGIGFSMDGVLICGEHGTAKMPPELLKTVKDMTGGLVEFAAGGILNAPIAKGLPMGLRRGNFRFKAALESHHNLKKNELAQLPGQKGADPEHAPENLESKVQHHKYLMKACVALEKERPDLFYHLQSFFPPYEQYRQAVAFIYERINDRSDHDLEGWSELGFLLQEWRMTAEDIWKPKSAFAKFGEGERGAIESVLRANPSVCLRNRRMSPSEAFTYCRAAHAHKIHRLPDCCIPMILGEALADKVPVDKDGSITIPDKYVPRRSTQVAGIVTDPDGNVHPLKRGESYLVWISPIDGMNAYISAADGVYMGVAPVMYPGTKIDCEAFIRNVAIQNKMERHELKLLAPVADAFLRERSKMAEENIKTLYGRTSSDLMVTRELSDKQKAEAIQDADDALLEVYGR